MLGCLFAAEPGMEQGGPSVSDFPKHQYIQPHFATLGAGGGGGGAGRRCKVCRRRKG